MIAPDEVLTQAGMKTFMARRALIGPHEFKPDILSKKDDDALFWTLDSKTAERAQNKLGGVMKGILLVAGIAGSKAIFALTASKRSKFDTKHFFTNREAEKGVSESLLVPVGRLLQ